MSWRVIKGQLIVATFIGILTSWGCRSGGSYCNHHLQAGVTNIIPILSMDHGIPLVILALMKSPITALWVVTGL